MIGFFALASSAALFTIPTQSDREMIADAHSIIREYGDQVWDGFSQAPLPILLIEEDQETLFCGAPIDGFVSAKFDTVTKCSMQFRSRELPNDLSAATYLGEHQVVMMGTASTLETTRAEWLVIVLHEAFHQYQSVLPAYVDATERVRVDFEGGTEQGARWMLDYPFPYADAQVRAIFAEMTGSALRFLEASSEQQKLAAIEDYLAARDRAARNVGPKSWAYFEFQTGQEGVARWSEIRIAAAAGIADPDLAAVAEETRLGLATSLRAIDRDGLNMWTRSAFYVLGAVEAEMLEQTEPAWRREYPRRPFELGAMLNTALAERSNATGI
jgi:hypothetical protein